MVAVHLLRPPIIPLIILLLLFITVTRTQSISEAEALLKLKKSFTNAQSLKSWTPDTPPCALKESWVGVVCFNGIVTNLRLGQMGLSGTIDVEALEGLKGLRSLSFVNNDLSGQIPSFSSLGALKGIYLSGNNFSGILDESSFGKIGSLKKLWLADNEIEGEIPESLMKLPHLIELHLEQNKFSGGIPDVAESGLKSFNVSNNQLSGEIPAGLLSKFDATSFAGNAGLCGKELGKECGKGQGSFEGGSGEEIPDPDLQGLTRKGSNSSNMSAAVVVLMVVVVGLLLATILVIKKRREDFNVLEKDSYDDSVEVYVAPDSIKKGGNEAIQQANANKGNDTSIKKGSQHGKTIQANANKGEGVADLTMVNKEKGIFGLPDLMKAAAEVLGSGNLGSAYKAVMANGVAVVVKRMREMNRIGKEGFEGEMRRLGDLRHRNILTPLAYHYRKEEKLIISEFMPKGSLLYLLHGDRGQYHADLNWSVRMKIIKGIANGLHFLYNELTSYDLPHGNLKSSNIFIDADNEPILSDYGFCAFVSPTQASQALFAYKSPEFIQYNQLSPKSDVYCLGIIIFEIVTGKFPSQYQSNGQGGTNVVQWVLSSISERKEAELFDPEIVQSASTASDMERLLHIGAACVQDNPDKRLDMKEAIKRIKELHIDGRRGSQA
ncbi:hypothetical protein Syun_026612 [Stephania yunnanensis]|uniref:Protein kinase domain-containing protein n=1 Tax=Stephania yunnanensis TaxID=152371 RepID=A0AAP0HVX3_9MAGN